MTAPLLALPISAPAASGGGQPATGTAGATGFEALMAAFFATGEADPSLPGDGEKPGVGADAEAQPADATPTTPVDAQTLAALLAVTPQSAQAATPAAAEGGEAGQAPAGAPPAAFSPLLAQEITTAPVATPVTSGAPAPALEGEAATTPVEPGLAEIPDAAAAALPAANETKAKATETTAPGLEKPREGQVTPAAQHAQAKGAPPAHAAAAQSSPPPAQPEAAVDPVVQAEAAATEVETPAEPAKEQTPAKASKIETGRRGATTAATHTAAMGAPVNDTVAAAAPAVAADTSGEAASAIEAEPVAVTPGETTPQTADAPDVQGPANTSAAAHNAAAPIADAPLPVRGSPETVAHLAAQIVKKLEGRSTRFDVELNPAGLGHVNVSVEIGAQGKMTAALQFESAQAANELRGRAPELQKALEQAGFDLSGGGLSFDVAGDRGQGQGRGDLYQQQQQQHDGGAWRGRAFQAVLDTADGAAETAAAAALHLQRRPTTGVDVRV